MFQLPVLDTFRAKDREVLRSRIAKSGWIRAKRTGDGEQPDRALRPKQIAPNEIHASEDFFPTPCGSRSRAIKLFI